MRAIIILIVTVSLSSCTKDWECCIVSTTTHTHPDLQQLNGTSTHCVDYRGDNQEKEEFESNGTSTTTHSADGYPFTINQETECKPD